MSLSNFRERREYLVDDEKQIAEMTTRILDRLGYRVTTFTNSQEALDRFLAGPDDFDLLITDLNMPKISGTKLILSIHAERPSLPVIAFSGFSEKITETNCASYGIKHFVMKPVVTMELAGVIRDAIGPRSETVNPGKLEQVKQPK